MAEYEVQLAPAVQRELRKLERATLLRIVRALEKLGNNPRPGGVEKLSQDPRFWRKKVGDYRVIYTIEENPNAVIVVVVRHRKDAYRNLDQLDARLLAATVGDVLVGIAEAAKPV